MKRIFALLLALMMAVSLTSVTVFADGLLNSKYLEALADGKISTPAPDSYIDDSCNVLDDVAALQSMASKIHEVTGVVVSFCSVEEAGENNDVETYVKEYAAANLPYEDCVLLMADTDDYSYIFYFSGVAEVFYEDANWDALCEAYNVESYQEGVENCMKKVYSLLTGFELERAMEFQQVERELPLVLDRTDALSDEELAELNEMAETTSESYQCEVAVVLVPSLEGESSCDYADDFYDYNGYGYGDNDDGIMLLIAVEDREFWMTTHGTGMDFFGTSALDDLKEEFLPYLADNDWYGAARAFLKQADYHLMKENEPAYVSPFWLLVDLAAGFLISMIPLGVMKLQMKQVHQKHEATEYVAKNGVHFREKRDIFLRTSVVRRAKPQEERSGGGGGGSHISSSGRSHGGSGGRF